MNNLIERFKTPNGPTTYLRLVSSGEDDWVDDIEDATKFDDRDAERQKQSLTDSPVTGPGHVYNVIGLGGGL